MLLRRKTPRQSRHTALVLPRDGPHSQTERGPRPRHRPGLSDRQILVLTDHAYQGADAAFGTSYQHHHRQ